MNDTPESTKSSGCQLAGSYQFPSLDFLQQPDRDVKPGESKDEHLIKAQLIQLTLALFNIEVSLGDITTGPTITRYELNPAPGVKLETIVALANNLAAALKAERIHILAPIWMRFFHQQSQHSIIPQPLIPMQRLNYRFRDAA